MEHLVTGKMVVAMEKGKRSFGVKATRVISAHISLAKAKCVVTPKIRWATQDAYALFWWANRNGL